MSTAENTFISGVNKHLPDEVYAEKMSNPYRGGTPDVFYEGDAQRWAEYKFVEKIPKRESTLIVPALSELQRDWLQRNFDQGHQPLVIVGARTGTKTHGYIFWTPGAWNHGVSAGAFLDSMLTKEQIADLIVKHVSR